MHNNKICCPETKVNNTLKMNDRDYLSDILNNEKQITTNTVVALTESSNNNLHDFIQDIFSTVEKLQATSYEIAWNNGWYTLEESEQTKINETCNNLIKKTKELKDK